MTQPWWGDAPRLPWARAHVWLGSDQYERWERRPFAMHFGCGLVAFGTESPTQFFFRDPYRPAEGLLSQEG